MKEVHIVWNKVTAHSRFWAVVIFVGVIPATAFYAGIRVESYSNYNAQLSRSAQQILYRSERGLCRVSDCTLQTTDNSNTTTPASTSTIKVVVPKQGQHINSQSSVQVIWNISPNFPTTQVSILLLDASGHAASKLVKAPAKAGSAALGIPTKPANSPYVVLIQGMAQSGPSSGMPFAYSGEFYI